MKKSLIALLLLSACGGGGEGGNNMATPATSGGAGAGGKAQGGGDGGPDAAKSAVATAELTGLYESGGGARRNQLCILDKGTGNAQFGIIAWGAGTDNCMGAGSAVRRGERLTLTMSGDQSCTLDATIRGGAVSLPAAMPAGCAYYCGAGAKLGGVTLAKVGGTAADAMRARDIVGEPLCEADRGR
jgi:hypothetical protein